VRRFAMPSGDRTVNTVWMWAALRRADLLVKITSIHKGSDGVSPIVYEQKIAELAVGPAGSSASTDEPGHAGGSAARSRAAARSRCTIPR